jgi:hypothetical protein
LKTLAFIPLRDLLTHLFSAINVPLRGSQRPTPQ